MSMRTDTRPNVFARSMFRALPRRYDTLAFLLSFGQDRRWRAAVVDHITSVRPKCVLDVACGPCGVTLAIARGTDARIVGIDLTESMLRQGAANVRAAGLDTRITLALARAEELPFVDGVFDAISFSYLMRYVADPEATLVELARCLKPGGALASLEFHVPQRAPAFAGWWAYTRIALPLLGFLGGGRAWFRVGRFLGPSIAGYVARFPEAAQVRAWQAAGLRDVVARRMSFGGGLVLTATKSKPDDG
jgi:demethylmenaquinone methyltransferase/2-methoxy-6-polyprenyl-1,4-benzoquinol methylase